MGFWMVPHTGADEPLFSLPAAARLARISMDLLRQSVSEGLVHPQPMAGGEEGLTYGEARRLLHVRSLVEDLGLEVSAVEVLLGEIRRLQRRVAQEPDWR